MKFVDKRNEVQFSDISLIIQSKVIIKRHFQRNAGGTLSYDWAVWFCVCPETVGVIILFRAQASY